MSWRRSLRWVYTTLMSPPLPATVNSFQHARWCWPRESDDKSVIINLTQKTHMTNWRQSVKMASQFVIVKCHSIADWLDSNDSMVKRTVSWRFHWARWVLNPVTACKNKVIYDFTWTAFLVTLGVICQCFTTGLCLSWKLLMNRVTCDQTSSFVTSHISLYIYQIA